MKKVNVIIEQTQKKNLQDWLEALNEFSLERLIPFQEMGKGYMLVDRFEVVHQEENHIQASIIGNIKYLVELFYDRGTIFSSCTCPVTGICKHQAGLMLSFATEPK